MVTYDELFGFVTMLCTVITLVIYALRKKYRPSVTSTGAEFQKILSRPGGHGKYLPTHEIFFHKPPTTIREYKRSAKTDLQELMSIKICDLTQETVQQAINHEALTHSPKSVRNMHDLLSAVLQAYRPAFALRTSLPQKERPALYIPSDDDI